MQSENKMTLTTSRKSFVFVTSNGPCVPQDEGTRDRIRRQAMSRVKSSRQQRAEGQTRKPGDQHITIMARQENSLCEDSHKSASNATDADEALITSDGANLRLSEQRNRFLDAIPSKPTSTGYEVVRMKYQFDVLDLSGFTTFYISQAEARPLLGHPSRILSMFRSRQWSFFSYVPARFGHSQCCDDAGESFPFLNTAVLPGLIEAVRCVAAACHSIVVNDNPRSFEVFSLYRQSLQSLQKALSHPDERLKPDTLCAVDILAIYEASLNLQASNVQELTQE